MKVIAFPTHKLTVADRDLLAVLDAYLPICEEGAVLALASKIAALCEGRTVAADQSRQGLVEAESDFWLPPEAHPLGVALTLKAGRLVPNAGIDESNVAAGYVLWPRDPQAVVNGVRVYLQQRFGLTRVGVVLTDSHITPLRWGVTGMALAHSGFAALNDYVGQPDLFGRPLRMTKLNVAEALATAAALVMGEGAEQTPLALITDLPFVRFQPRDPTAEELGALQIPPEIDLYAPLLQGVAWRAGRGGGD